MTLNRLSTLSDSGEKSENRVTIPARLEAVADVLTDQSKDKDLPEDVASNNDRLSTIIRTIFSIHKCENVEKIKVLEMCVNMYQDLRKAHHRIDAENKRIKHLEEELKKKPTRVIAIRPHTSPGASYASAVTYGNASRNSMRPVRPLNGLVVSPPAENRKAED